MQKFITLFSALLALFAQASLAQDFVPTGKKAHCDLTSVKGDFLGKIVFSEVKLKNDQETVAVKIEASLSDINLPDGLKGFHIHQFPDTGDECKKAGPHFNPHNMQHGSPLDHTNRHLGDLGNLHVLDKRARLDILDSRIRLAGKEKIDGIIQRAIVLHEKEDNLGKGVESDSKTTGSAGSRHACCIINEG